MSRDVMYVRGDDWEGVYIDGELVDQGHSVDWMYVIGQLGCNTYVQYPNLNWLHDCGRLPADLNEVVFEET